MTPEELAKRLEVLRSYHATTKPHYETADSSECGCGQCNEYLLLSELERLERDAALAQVEKLEQMVRGAMAALKVYGASIIAAPLQKRIQELEAQLAAMREALKAADHAICTDPRTTTGYAPGSPDIPALGIIRAGLATDAGKAMLERHERELGALSDAFDDMEAQMFATKERAEKAEERIAGATVMETKAAFGRGAQWMRERAAKVAESAVGFRILIEPTIPEAIRTIAAAIRALDMEET